MPERVVDGLVAFDLLLLLFNYIGYTETYHWGIFW